jgi:hypothetical protein
MQSANISIQGASMSRVNIFLAGRLWQSSQHMLLVVLATLALTACEKPVNPNDLPVSYWPTAKPHEVSGSSDCSVASAKAILKSGLPYPNYGTVDELAKDGVTVNKRIKTADVWIGETRFVFPAELVKSGGFPANNPSNMTGLSGTLPHFYPKGEMAPEIDGMGAMVDVSFYCNLDANALATWGTIQSTEDRIQVVKKRYEERARSVDLPGTVTVGVREDLGMTEVLLKQGDWPRGFWEATYFPLHTELRGLDGGVSPIGCRTRHESPMNPDHMGAAGIRCGAGMRVTPQAYVGIDIYVSHIKDMPSVFEQVKQVVIDAKKAGQ